MSENRMCETCRPRRIAEGSHELHPGGDFLHVDVRVPQAQPHPIASGEVVTPRHGLDALDPAHLVPEPLEEAV